MKVVEELVKNLVEVMVDVKEAGWWRRRSWCLSRWWWRKY